MTAPPNILLVVIDSARRDRVSAYGYDQPTTPNLDEISAEGVRFNAAYSESTWTLPACFTLLTGMAPREHCGEDHRSLPAGLPTIGSALSGAGYTVLGSSSNSFYGPRSGLDRDFDSFFEPPTGAVWKQIYTKYTARRLGRLDAGGRAATEDLIERISAAPGPWCAILWLDDAHHPYTAPWPYATRFCRQRIPWHRRWRLWERMRRMPTLAITASERDLVDISGLYDGGLAYEDMLVGEMRAALARLGVWDSTVLFVLADHGDMLGERGLLGHGREADVYQPLIRVPLIVRGPGFLASPTGSDALVQLADVTRTVAEIAGIPASVIPTAAPTVDLRDAATGQGRPYAICERKPFSPHSLEGVRKRNPDVDFTPHLCHMTAAVRDGWKLIYRDERPPELYHIAEDPDEQTDLAASETARAAGLIDLVTEWRALAEPHPAAVAAGTDDSPIVEKRLQDLGYF